MSEAPLYNPVNCGADCAIYRLGASLIQGYLAHKNHPPPRTLQKDYTQGHMVVLGGGLFFISELPLSIIRPERLFPTIQIERIRVSFA